MTRSEFIAVTALILFGAFVLGWLASWLVHRVARPAQGDMTELDRLAKQLHDAQDQRDRAIAEARDREAALNSRLTGAEAELNAAMEGLRESRSEVEELRDYIERALARR
ncbi:hypothetical protein D3P06_12900 [Paracoccus aestuarii]|uniref:Uncharacterized protein n=1 Tax=Paracoccus aestuarii TaxID=453842 RepID=A0A418ZTA2_9RHOB|nr:hypothetical protein [Paracoccus aestuarii]RJL00976.1 hypothetical protein D3P06_12900 [Paracoccus aestuarii]WCQ98918.1 hypothetical protein JHW48_13845 [Paracoccus aestuarii]